MTTKETHKMAVLAGRCLQKAVREELQKKALLGQYVIINRNGRACRVSAKEALKMTRARSVKDESRTSNVQR
jgi:hypothetical protein